MSTVPVARKRQRAEQVVPTFGPKGDGEAAGSPHLREEQPAVTVENADYPIPNFETLYTKMREPETGLSIEDRRWRLMTYPQCFLGSEMVDWMVRHAEGDLDRTAAVEMGQKLLDAGILHHVTRSEPFADGYFFYRFQEDEQTSVLNMKRVWDSNRRARYAVDVSVDMITRLACLCEEHRRHLQQSGSAEGSASTVVDYAALAKSDAFRQYVLSGAELQVVDISNLTTDEKLAFFVNVYNTLCLHGHVVYGAPTNFLKRMSFFRGMAYRVAGLDYTLDDIEHGILRGNKRPPSLRFMQQLRPSDPKCQHVLNRREERIHFVISAGTPSDPPIRILDNENLVDELHEATEEFLNQTIKVDVAKKEVTVPRIFSWYADDFPKPEMSMLRWVSQYLKKDLQNTVLSLISDNAPPTIIYQNFDWTNSEAQFNAAVVRRKRRRLERERALANGEVVSPNLNTYSPAFGSTGSFGSPNVGSFFATATTPEMGRAVASASANARSVLASAFVEHRTPTLTDSRTTAAAAAAAAETPALSNASVSRSPGDAAAASSAVGNSAAEETS